MKLNYRAFDFIGIIICGLLLLLSACNNVQKVQPYKSVATDTIALIQSLLDDKKCQTVFLAYR